MVNSWPLSLRAEQSATSQSVDCTNQKSALLIGIRSNNLEPASSSDLKFAHDNVHKMRDFLVEGYGYTLSQVTVLVDDGIEGHPQPTRGVILEAIRELVKDVKAGDHLYFYYSGNSIQITDDPGEDGMSTCLITSDGLDIRDNELHSTLVKPLPSGSHLVAVLDTSHSGSLLRLDHSLCNRVYVPWVNKGNGNSEEIRDTVVRGNARLATIPPKASQTHHAHTNSTEKLPSIMGTSSASSSRPLPAAGSYLKPKSLARLRAGTKGSLMRLRTLTLSVPSHNLDKNNEQLDTWIIPDEEVHCDSPVEQVPCNGWCRTLERSSVFEEDVQADVILLASCRSSEWIRERDTMTSRLVNILRDDPHQSLQDVLIRISHASYSSAVQRHRESKSYKKKRKAYAASIVRRIKQLERRHRSTVSSAPSENQPAIAPRRLTFPQVNMPRPWQLLRTIGKTLADLKQKLNIVDQERGYDMAYFQNPELSSPRPLDMNRLWNM